MSNPKVAEVVFYPIYGEISDNLDFCLLRRNGQNYFLHRVRQSKSYYHVNASSLAREGKYYLLKIESKIKKPFSGNPTIWQTVINCGINLIDSTTVISQGVNYVKIIQTFRIEIENIDHQESSYVQFMCQRYNVRFEKNHYHSNDIITLLINNKKNIDYCPIVIIKPSKSQNYVSINKFQSLQLFINPNYQNLELQRVKNSILQYTDKIEGSVENQKYAFHYFDFVKESDLPQLIGVRMYNDVKTISVTRTIDDYVQVHDPINDSYILTEDMKGVKIYSKFYFRLLIAESCPAKLLYIQRNGENSEYKIKFTSRCNQLSLVKRHDDWLLTLP